MPELPEVETLRRQLKKVLVGQRLRKIKVLRKKSLQGPTLEVKGRKILGVGRRAKVLIIRLEKGLSLLVHLKMTGQLVYVSDTPSGSDPEGRVVGGHPTLDWLGKLPSRHSRVIFELEKGRLYFNDMRGFGWVKIVDLRQKKVELAKYGPEVNGKRFNFNYLQQTLKSSKRPVKVVIMDQKKIAGVGNIYANDALWLAGIDPRRSAVVLAGDEKAVKKLVKCLKTVIKKGIKLGGASASDFVHVDGLGGSYQKHFLVYKKERQKCNRCGGIIRKIKLAGRGSYFCPQCQK